MLRSMRKRQTKTPYTPTPTNCRQTNRKKTNYNIAKKKALTQKLEATERDNLSAEFKEGNLVLTFLTAASEAFRGVLKVLQNGVNPFKDVMFDFDIRVSKDGSTINEESVAAYQNHHKQYRLNLYLTTSVATINGTNIRLFYAEHMPYFIEEMCKIGNFNQLNQMLKNELSKLLASNIQDSSGCSKGIEPSAPMKVTLSTNQQLLDTDKKLPTVLTISVTKVQS